MSTVQGDDRLEGAAPAEPTTPTAPAAPPQRRTRKGEASATSGKGEGSATTDKGEGSANGGKSQGTSTRRRSRAASTAVADAPAAEAPSPVTEANGALVPRLIESYRSEVVPTMMQEFAYSNVMQVPGLKKVVLNIGLGEALTNPKAIESATKDLTTISGQKPILTRARKSIAGFKLREGNPIGLSVTLRGARMYHFMDRLLNTALPRIRDFRGVPTSSFDGRGNYSMGIREQIIFPEIDYGQIERIRGLQVTIATSAKTDGEAARLLALMGMPFARQD